jgi:hypothetical protein
MQLDLLSSGAGDPLDIFLPNSSSNVDRECSARIQVFVRLPKFDDNRTGFLRPKQSPKVGVVSLSESKYGCLRGQAAIIVGRRISALALDSPKVVREKSVAVRYLSSQLFLPFSSQRIHDRESSVTAPIIPIHDNREVRLNPPL